MLAASGTIGRGAVQPSTEAEPAAGVVASRIEKFARVTQACCPSPKTLTSLSRSDACIVVGTTSASSRAPVTMIGQGSHFY